MIAKIYYYIKQGHHSDNLELKQLWHTIEKDFDGSEVQLTRKLFNSNWKMLPFKESSKKHNRDVLFAKYNSSDKNPLANDNGQEILRSLGLKHTSMSIGDIVKFRTVYWMCVSEGWVKVRFSNEDLT